MLSICRAFVQTIQRTQNRIGLRMVRLGINETAWRPSQLRYVPNRYLNAALPLAVRAE